MSDIEELDLFTRSYIATALWSSNDESTPQGGNPLDENYSISDIALETLAQMKADCQRFQADNRDTLDELYNSNAEQGPACAGHDFWLTRCGHGAGFWDGDYPEPAGSILTKAAQAFGDVDLYVGDDGKIYS